MHVRWSWIHWRRVQSMLRCLLRCLLRLRFRVFPPRPCPQVGTRERRHRAERMNLPHTGIAPHFRPPHVQLRIYYK